MQLLLCECGEHGGQQKACTSTVAHQHCSSMTSAGGASGNNKWWWYQRLHLVHKCWPVCGRSTLELTSLVSLSLTSQIIKKIYYKKSSDGTEGINKSNIYQFAESQSQHVNIKVIMLCVCCEADVNFNSIIHVHQYFSNSIISRYIYMNRERLGTIL